MTERPIVAFVAECSTNLKINEITDGLLNAWKSYTANNSSTVTLKDNLITFSSYTQGPEDKLSSYVKTFLDRLFEPFDQLTIESVKKEKLHTSFVRETKEINIQPHTPSAYKEALGNELRKHGLDSDKYRDRKATSVVHVYDIFKLPYGEKPLKYGFGTPVPVNEIIELARRAGESIAKNNSGTRFNSIEEAIHYVFSDDTDVNVAYM